MTFMIMQGSERTSVRADHGPVPAANNDELRALRFESFGRDSALQRDDVVLRPASLLALRLLH